MDDDRFGKWFDRVDAIVSARAGLGADDLPDQPYYDWFESGMTPKEAAQAVLAEVADEMGFAGLFG